MLCPMLNKGLVNDLVLYQHFFFKWTQLVFLIINKRNHLVCIHKFCKISNKIQYLLSVERKYNMFSTAYHPCKYLSNPTNRNIRKINH